jgi:hypothetical protein
MKAETIQAIKEAGFSVYMREEKDTYAYFTDGVKIGYIQEERWNGISISTVHVPCHECGTGFSIEKNIDAISKERLEQAFIFAPHWASRISAVKKWRDIQHFLGSDKWNAGFKKI